jgi:hypothetical protein
LIVGYRQPSGMRPPLALLPVKIPALSLYGEILNRLLKKANIKSAEGLKE